MELRINVQLPLDRTKAGTVTLKNAAGQTLAGPFEALGKADNLTAAGHGNPARDPLKPYGDTPAGTYEVPRLVSTGAGTAYGPDSYGPNGALVLKPVGGDALTAAANGRVGLLVHSGKIGAGNKLRPTHGCVRLRNGDMKSLVDAIQAASGASGVRCEVVRVSVIVGTDPAPDEGTDAGDPPPNMLELIQGTFPGPVTPLP